MTHHLPSFPKQKAERHPSLLFPLPNSDSLQVWLALRDGLLSLFLCYLPLPQLWLSVFLTHSISFLGLLISLPVFLSPSTLSLYLIPCWFPDAQERYKTLHKLMSALPSEAHLTYSVTLSGTPPCQAFCTSLPLHVLVSFVWNALLLFSFGMCHPWGQKLCLPSLQPISWDIIFIQQIVIE